MILLGDHPSALAHESPNGLKCPSTCIRAWFFALWALEPKLSNQPDQIFESKGEKWSSRQKHPNKHNTLFAPFQSAERKYGPVDS